MSEKKVVLDEALKFAWEGFKDNVGALLLCMALPLIGAIVFQGAFLFGFQAAGMGQDVANNLATIIGFPVSTLVNMGMCKIALKVYNKEPFSLNDMIPGPSYVPFLIGAALFGIMITVGFIFLVIPAIIVGLTFGFFDFLIVDKQLGGVDGIKKSMELTKGVKVDLFLFFLVSAMISVVGILCFGIGIFPAIIIVVLAKAHVYRQLAGATSAAQ